jgi:1-phosphofructokinase family hexose kinase
VARQEGVVIVLGANLTTDRTLQLSRLVPGNVMRPRSAVVAAGGKSVNVCRAAGAHGVRPRLIANLPGRLGQWAGDLLDGEGHDVVRVRTAGEIRTATIIIEDDLRITVLNEPGPDLLADDRALLLDTFRAEAATGAHRVVAASGSLPPGPEAADLYAVVVRIAHDHGLVVVLDAARGDLARALPAGPDVVTPNLAEALGVLGGDERGEAVEPDLPDLHRTALDVAQQLRAAGAGTALVTVGRHGVAAAARSGTFWVEAPAVREVSSIGAGDAFVGGLGCALEQGAALPEAVRRAVATAAASVATDLAGHADADLLTRLLEETAPAVTGRAARDSTADEVAS